MKRKVLIALCALLALVLNSQQVSAQQFRGGIRFDAVAREDGIIDVVQEVDLINTSSQFLITSFTQTLPFDATAVTASVNGQRLPVTQEGRRLTVRLGEYTVQINQRRTIRLSYQVSQAVVTSGRMHEISWPQFDFSFPIDDYRVNLYFPEGWGQVTYADKDFLVAPERPGLTGIAIPSQVPFYMVTGVYSGLDFDAQFGLTHGAETTQLLRIALPDERLGAFQLGEVSGVDRGMVTDAGQRYFVTNVPQRQRIEGSFSGTWFPGGPDYPDTLQLEGPAADVSYLNLSPDNTADTVWNDLQRRLEPAESYILNNRLSIEDTIQLRSHSPLDYAHVYTAAYRSLGIPAHTVFGLTKLPNSESYSWHAWVAVNIAGEWLQQDPYLHDLYDYPFAQRVSPFHIPWLLLPDDTDPITMGMTAIDPGSLISFSDAPQELPMTFEPQVELYLTEEAYSARPLPLEVAVRNNGSFPIQIKYLQIDSYEPPVELYTQEWILPGREITIPVLGVTVDDPFFAGSKDLNGVIQIFADDNEVEFPLAVTAELVVDYRTLTINLTVALILIVAVSVGLRHRIFSFSVFRR